MDTTRVTPSRVTTDALHRAAYRIYVRRRGIAGDVLFEYPGAGAEYEEDHPVHPFPALVRTRPDAVSPRLDCLKDSGIACTLIRRLRGSSKFRQLELRRL
jgi:hypothetical protein